MRHFKEDIQNGRGKFGRIFHEWISRKRDIHGQTTTETAVLIMVIIFAFIAMQVYLKRGLQGRLRASIDSIGEQYDYDRTTSDYNMARESDVTTTSTSSEEVFIDPSSWGGQYQNRLITIVNSQTHYDNTFRTGFEYVGAP